MQTATIALVHTLSAQQVQSVALTAVHLMLALPCRYVFRTCQVTQCAQKEPFSQCMQDATPDAAPVWVPTCVKPATVSAPAIIECPSVCLTPRVSAAHCRSRSLPSSAHSRSSGGGQPSSCCAAVCPSRDPGPKLAGCACRTRLHPNNIEDGSLYLSVTMLACSCLAKAPGLPLWQLLQGHTCLP